MKKTNEKIFLKGFMGLFFFILFASCNKNEPSCENCHYQVRCKIDGVSWDAYCDPDPPFGCYPSRLQYYDDSKFLELTTRNDKTGESFHLIVRKLDENGKNKFESGSVFGNGTNSPSCLVYQIDTSEMSYLIVKKIDGNSRFIISEFSFVAKNSCNEVVTVTDGYFDLNY